MEDREMKVERDNSYMFKRFAKHNPSIYGGNPDPKPSRTGFGHREVV